MQVDMFERLPTPYGLVRFGVAPDHPEVKNVINDFAAVAASPGFRFFGNVEVGAGSPRQLPMGLLRRAYDAVIVCTGAQGERLLGVPGEDLRGVVGAPAFVKWYNGHPDHVDIGAEAFEPGAAAVVIGQGNVALDVARILARAPRELHETDIEGRTIAAIKLWQERGLRTVHVVGRRGFVQAAFTNAELRELLSFSDEVLTVVDPAELALCRNEASEQELASNRPKKRSLDILAKMAANFAQKDDTSKRILQLRFLSAPTEVLPGPDGSSIAGVRLARMRLEGPAGAQRAVAAEGSEVVPCGLLVRSVGFGLTPLDGLPLDESRRVPHQQGRVEAADKDAAGLYVSGWCKRGPTGIIASNIADAQETAARVLADLHAQASLPRLGASAAEEAMVASGRKVVSFEEWRTLEAEEKRRGAAEGRPAIKLTNVDEMLGLLGGAATS